MDKKIKNQGDAIAQVQTSSSFLILSSITLMLFVGDKSNFKKNNSNLIILYTAGVLSTLCVFINLYVLINVNRHIKNIHLLLASNLKLDYAKKYHNQFMPNMRKSMVMFWFSIILFLLSVYCLVVFKLDIVTKKNNFLFIFFTLSLIFCFIALIYSDYKDRNFFKKNNISMNLINHL